MLNFFFPLFRCYRTLFTALGPVHKKSTSYSKTLIKYRFTFRMFLIQSIISFKECLLSALKDGDRLLISYSTVTAIFQVNVILQTYYWRAKVYLFPLYVILLERRPAGTPHATFHCSLNIYNLLVLSFGVAAC